MLAIDQIKEMCREYRETTSKADNSLRELLTEMRAVRRQEVGLLVKFLTVNRTLLEIKRDTQRTLARQDSNSRRSSLDLYNSPLTIKKSDQSVSGSPKCRAEGTESLTLSEKILSGNNVQDGNNLSTQCRENGVQESPATLQDGSYSITTARQGEIDERTVLFVRNRNSPTKRSTEDNQKLREIPEHQECPCGHTESDETEDEEHRRSRSFSCDSMASRRESGYESCTEMESEERDRRRTSSTSSVASFTSSSALPSPRPFYSSQLSLSPPISASISTILI